MPSLRKLPFHNCTYFVTISVEQGVLWQCNPLCKGIVIECLAKSQDKYPVIISHYLVQSTHIHFIITLDNPDDLKDFIGYFKTESAHRINRVLGRKKRTVWCEGYDSPQLLTAEDVIERIVYIYSNAAKDGLEDSIDKYPNLNSWQIFIEGQTENRTECKVFTRDVYEALEAGDNNYKGYEKEAERISSLEGELKTFAVNPNGWMGSFGITVAEEQAKVNEDIKRRVRGEEERYRSIRIVQGYRPFGAERLKQSKIDTTYLPDRKGKRTWCICYLKEIRDRFISFARDLCQKAREAYQGWLGGRTEEDDFPLGVYPPAGPKRGNLLYAH